MVWFCAMLCVFMEVNLQGYKYRQENVLTKYLIFYRNGFDIVIVGFMLFGYKFF